MFVISPSFVGKDLYRFFTKLCFLSILLSFTACVKTPGPECYVQDGHLVMSSINIIDRNGMSEIISNPERLKLYENVDFLEPQPYQKVLRIYARDAQGCINARITSYHPNSYPRQYLEVVNSRAYGTYKEWYQNGTQKIEATIIEGAADIVEGSEKTWIFDGCCQVWNECGNLEAAIPYVKGMLEGESIYYHANGNIWKKVPYCQNQKNGLVEVFCADGTLLQSYNYVMGLKQGEALRYWPNDVQAAVENYCDDFLTTGAYYNSEGELISSIEEGNGMRAIFGKNSILELQEYKYGLLDGEIKVFDEFGRVNKVYHVHNQCKHGEEVFYYDAVMLQKTLIPKLLLNWNDGKLQGVSKSWYPNGVQESQKEISNNKKNGHNTAWYRDGSLMLIEEYEQDRLLRGEYYNKGEKYPISSVNDGKGIVTLYDCEGNFLQKINYIAGKPELNE